MFKKIADAVKRGLNKDTAEKMGALGEGVYNLGIAIEDAIAKGYYVKSPLFKSIHVVLDSLKIHRQALEEAVAVINLLEADPPEDIQARQKLAIRLAERTQRFKLLAVGARLHQAVPFEKIPQFGKLVNPETTH